MNKKSFHCLLVDVTQPRELSLRLYVDSVLLSRYHAASRYFNLLGHLDKFLNRHQLAFTDFDCLALLEGGGSFSGVRQAAAVLNVLHLLTGVRVLGIDKRSGGDGGKRLFMEMKRARPNRGYLKPIYSGEPNIT